MEDFGYSKEQDENYLAKLFKRAFMLGATLFSIFCFIYITHSAVNYFSQNRGEVKIIEASVDPIKIIETAEIQNQNSLQIDSSIYEDIFGNKKKNHEEITVKKLVLPELPPKENIKTGNIQTKIESTKDNSNQKIIIYQEQEIQNQPKVLLSQENKTKTASKNIDKKGKNYIRVQLAAMTSKQAAYKYFQDVKNKNSELFYGLEDFIQEVDLGKRGIFYRVQVGNFYDQIRAESFCKKYITQTSKNKADCIIVE